MPGSALPIALSAAAGLGVVAVVRRSAHERPSPPLLFWLTVALPVLVLWALRAPLVDVGYDTLGGFVSNAVGHIPPMGTMFEHSGARFTVLDAEPHRVKRVRIELFPQAVEAERGRHA